MIQSEFRLKRKKDIEVLMKEGVFFGGAFATMKIWKIDPELYPRRELTTNHLLIGFSVGKKLSKSAVKRNYQRRRLREAIRLLMKEQPFARGYLVLLIAKSELVEASFDDIKKDLHKLCKRSSLL